MKAIETTGVIDDQQRLVLDEAIPLPGPGRVRVIILVPEASDVDEKEWLQAAAGNPAFGFLRDRGEDFYTPSDGKPFHDQG